VLNVNYMFKWNRVEVGLDV